MKKFIPFTFTLLISASTIAQSNNIKQPELDSGTIEAQFDYIINKSTKFRDFQLIRKPSILKVKAHALDSLKSIRKDLIVANKSTAQLKGTIRSLEKEVETLKNEVTAISEDVDSISFMGISLSKLNYNMIVWSLIVLLLLGLIIFVSMFKKSNIITKNNQFDLSKIENEFEAFRKKSMLKEQEVMRKLQNELNKNSH